MAGRYRLAEVLGEGGMGAVWRAHDERIGREVALKQLKLPLRGDARLRGQLVARMEREARAVGALKHPSVITVYDQFHGEDGLPWIVMELVRGPSLAEVISGDGPLEEARAARIGAQIAEALAAAHQAQIVHRDIKPSNILLEGPRAVVTDFGIAAVAGETTLTASGALLGSPAYMAPEQVNDREATAASDVWSLGATLYAAVEGRPAFTGTTTAALLLAVSRGEPAAPTRARLLKPLLRDLMHIDPDRRPTAAHTATALRQHTAPPQIARGQPAGTTDGASPASSAANPSAAGDKAPEHPMPNPPGGPGRPARASIPDPAGASRSYLFQRRPFTALVAAVCLALLTGGGWLAWDHLYNSQPPQPPQPQSSEPHEDVPLVIVATDTTEAAVRNPVTGSVIFQGPLTAGMTLEFDDAPLGVVVADGGAVRVKVYGEVTTPRPPGQRAEWEVPER